MNKTDFMNQLEQYFEEYLQSIKQASNRTIQTYGQSFMVLFDYFETKHNKKNYKIKFEDFTPDLIDNYVIYLKEDRKYSSSSIRQRLVALSSFLKYSSRRNICAIKGLNSINSINKPKTNKGDFSYFSKEEMAELLKIPDLKKSNGFRDLVVLSLLYDSAARESEFCALKVSDIKFGTPTKVRLYGKGRKIREVPITPQVSELIKKYLKRYDLEGKYDEYLFKNIKKEPITPAMVKYLINTSVNKLKNNRTMGFEKYSPHSFRHSKAIHMLEAGIPLIYIKDYLGHSSVKTTEIYAQVTQRNMNLVIGKLNEDNKKIFNTQIDTLDMSESYNYPYFLKNKRNNNK